MSLNFKNRIYSNKKTLLVKRASQSPKCGTAAQCSNISCANKQHGIEKIERENKELVELLCKVILVLNEISFYLDNQMQN